MEMHLGKKYVGVQHYSPKSNVFVFCPVLNISISKKNKVSNKKTLKDGGAYAGKLHCLTKKDNADLNSLEILQTFDVLSVQKSI